MRKIVAVVVAILMATPTGTLAQCVAETSMLNGLWPAATTREAEGAGQGLAPSPSTQPTGGRRWVRRHLVLAGTLVGTSMGVARDLAVCSDRGQSRETLTGASAETARLVQSPAAPPPTADRENWIQRHLVLFGTVIGTGAGVAFAANGQHGGPVIVVGGALGGAYGGLVASAIHKARREEPVGRKTKIGIVIGGIGVGLASILVPLGLGGV